MVADHLPDPAIGSLVSRDLRGLGHEPLDVRGGYDQHGDVATLRDLKAKVLPRVEGRPPGLVVTALPGLWFFHSPKCQPPKRSDTRMVTLAVILQGRKKVDFGDVTYVYHPGDFLFVLGEQRYLATVELAKSSEPYVSMAVQLEPEVIAKTVLELADAGLKFEDADAEPPAVVGRLERPIIDALDRLVGTLDDPVGRAVLAPLAKRELIVHLLRSPQGASLRRAAATDDERIRRAVDYLQAHASERITVEDVAREVAMSPSHFAHRFREIVRMSPMQYVKHLRLQQARLLMLGDGLGAAEAGAQVGYASASHFTRDFKSYFGAPPASYVQQFRAAS